MNAGEEKTYINAINRNRRHLHHGKHTHPINKTAQRLSPEADRRGRDLAGIEQGNHPMPRTIWNINTNAVAAYAVCLVPIESIILAMLKQKHNPPAETISKTRRPNRSTVQRGMNDAAR